MVRHEHHVRETQQAMHEGIDCLPDNVISCILSCLHTKEAVRTSVLSRQWRYNWKCAQDLSFYLVDFHKSLVSDETYTNKLVNVLNHVLSNHTGNIRRFTFSTYLKKCTEMDSWIDMLKHHNIEELVLRFLDRDNRLRRYTLPPSLFQCEKLTSLALDFCELRIPPGFHIFPSLKFLSLGFVFLHDIDAVQRLTSSCPSLLELNIISLNCIDATICAPSLLKLKIDTYLKSIRLVNALKVRCLSVGSRLLTKAWNMAKFDNWHIRNFINSLSGLSELENFQIDEHFLKLLSIHTVIPNHSITLSRVKTLQLGDWSFECLKVTQFALFLLKICPALQNLEIKCSSGYIDDIGDFWNDTGNIEVRFNYLETLRLLDMSGNVSEMNFIKYTLENSPKLVETEISFCFQAWIYERELGCFSEVILAMPRASPLVGSNFSFYCFKAPRL